MSGLLVIGGLVLAIAAHILTVFVARWGTTRLFGFRGMGLLPQRDNRQGKPLATFRQVIAFGVGLGSAYAFPALLFASALLIGGLEVAPAEAGTRVDVIPDKPAAEAGVLNGDRVVSVAGEPVSRWDELAAAIQKRPGETIEIVVERDGERIALEVTVPPEGRIGVSLAPERVSVGPLEALITGMKTPPRVAIALITGLYRWLVGDIEAEVGGPVMIVREAARSAEPSLADNLHLIGALDVYYGLPLAFLVAFIIRLRREPESDARRGQGARSVVDQSSR